MDIMTFFAISGLLNGISCLALGLFVYFKSKYSPINRTYLFFAISVAIWGFGYYFWPLAKTKIAAINSFRLLHFGAVFITVCYYHFVSALTDRTEENKRNIIIGYLLAFCFALFIPTKLFIKDMVPKFIFKFWAIPGALYHFYLLFFFAYVFLAIYILYREFKRSTGVKRKQYLYVLIASIVGYVGGSTNYPLWYDIPIYPAVNILVTLYVGITAYAIVRHQLMDIEVIIKKTLVFAGLLASVFAMLVLPTLIIQEYLFRVAGPGVRMVGLTISGLIIIFTVRRIEDFLINVTDKYLFQKKYDYKELLKTFTTEVLTVLDLNNLTNLTVQKLSNIVKPNSCAILLLDEQTDELKLSSSRGLKDNKITLSKRNELVTFLEKSQTYVLKSQSTPSAKIPDVILNNMARLEAEMVVPLILHEKFIGMLSLGKKKSDENYTQDDIDILLPLARTLAIAISNAELFDELGKTQAEAAQREKMAVIGTLASGINHEICNPLGIARGQCEAFLLNRKDGIYKNKSEAEQLNEVTRIMELVIKETDRATAITKKLSSFAKPSKGEVADSVDIAKEIDEVLALVGYELKMDKIELAKNIPANLPHIRADKKQLQEIFFNLIRNAAQAIKETGRITVSAQELDSKIIIDITDTGSGISEDKVEMIFNPFYTTKEPGKGTGLGLFIVRQVVERNKGKISLKSKINEGTTFTLEFPITSERR